MAHRPVPTRPTRPAALAAVALVVAVAALAAAALLAPAPARAQDGDDGSRGWGVQPGSATGPDGRSRFSYELAPGQVVDDHLVVTNQSAVPVTFRVYATDAFNTDGGGFDLLAASEQPADVGTWVTLGAAEVTVPARDRLVVPFQLRVPDGATPGDHTGGMVASLTTPGTGADGSPISVDRRVAARLQLRVAGELAPQLAVSDLSTTWSGGWNPLRGGDVRVTYTVTNTGNVRLGALPELAVTGPLGVELGSAPQEALPELLPGSQLTATASLSGVAPVGPLRVALALEPVLGEGQEVDGAVPVATASTTTWALPWAQVVASALVVAAVWGVVRWRRHRRRRMEAALAAATAAGRSEALHEVGAGAGPRGGPGRAGALAVALVAGLAAAAAAGAAHAPAALGQAGEGELVVTLVVPAAGDDVPTTTTPTTTAPPPDPGGPLPPDPAGPGAGSSAGTGSLPRTGSDLTPLAFAAGALVAGGATAVLLSRRARHRPAPTPRNSLP